MSSRKPVSTARPQTFWSIEYGFFLVVLDREVVALGILDGLVTGQREVADRGDALEVGRQGRDADLETDLVVALAGAAVGTVVGTELAGGGREVADDHRAGEGRHQRVRILVEAVGLRVGISTGRRTHPGRRRRGLHGATVEGALADGLDVLATLADVHGDGDTSLPVASSIQPMATDVSSPPEYARTMRSAIAYSSRSPAVAGRPPRVEARSGWTLCKSLHIYDRCARVTPPEPSAARRPAVTHRTVDP